MQNFQNESQVNIEQEQGKQLEKRQPIKYY